MKKILLFISFLVSMGCSVDASILQSEEYNGHKYFLLDRTNTWQEAENEAISLGGHLATINDAAENSWVLDTFKDAALTDMQNDLGNTNGIPSLWIGLTRQRGNPTWYWVSGEPDTYRNWHSGQPGNSWNEVTTGVILKNWEPVGTWHDINDPRIAQDIDYGLAEVVVTPEPASMVLFGLGGAAMAFARRRNK